MSRKNQNDFDNDFNDDITRIEDLPPLEHPPLPKLPEQFPEFVIPKLPTDMESPPSFEVSSNDFLSSPPPSAIPAEEEVAMEFEQIRFENQFEPRPEDVQSFEQEVHLDSPASELTATISNAPTLQNLDTDFETPLPSSEEPISSVKTKTVSEKIFEDVKEEMETFVLKHVPFESYPSYSLYISQIVNGMQRNTIKLLLKEYGLMQSDTEKELIHRSLQLKHILIPRISEYAAIFFANKLERLNVHIQLSPSEDLTSHHELWDKGPITQQSFHHHAEQGDIIKPTIFISQSFSFTDKSVKLLGIVLQQTVTIDRNELKDNFHFYFNRLQDLKEQAREVSANAIVGLNFQRIDQDDYDKVLFLVTGEAANIYEE